MQLAELLAELQLADARMQTWSNSAKHLAELHGSTTRVLQVGLTRALNNDLFRPIFID
jgi:hypothetical protein